MIYRAKPGQVSCGEAIGIIILDSCAPFIPGDVANATTYDFPVRFQRVSGLTVERIFSHDRTLLGAVAAAAADLARNGVRAITGDCGFLAIFQEDLAGRLELPVFMSSLLQVPLIDRMIGKGGQVGIITASAAALDDEVLRPCGADLGDKLAVRGLEGCPHFKAAFIEERGELDPAELEKEVVRTVQDLLRENPRVRALLLECSVLPPYAAGVQKISGLPVFDFVTMINYVYSAVVRKRFSGFC